MLCDFAIHNLVAFAFRKVKKLVTKQMSICSYSQFDKDYDIQALTYAQLQINFTRRHVYTRELMYDHQVAILYVTIQH